MFNFIKNKLEKIYQVINAPLQAIFSKPKIDESTIQDLEKLLLRADAGVKTTKKIINHLQLRHTQGSIQNGQQLQSFLEHELEDLLQQNNPDILTKAQIFLLVGINGSGKTTFAGKLAYYLKNQNKKCIIVAADTFRAAAHQQLYEWALRAQAQFVSGKPNQDPASIVFDACKKFQEEQQDILIIDTAGRLQNKENLMQELAKIKRTINKQLPNYQVCTLLTIDSMLGQNSLDQAQMFNTIAQIDGIILTKMDGTAKGGIIFAIVQELKIPILFLSWGEQIEDLALFEPKVYVQNLLDIKKIKESFND